MAQEPGSTVTISRESMKPHSLRSMFEDESDSGDDDDEKKKIAF